MSNSVSIVQTSFWEEEEEADEPPQRSTSNSSIEFSHKTGVKLIDNADVFRICTCSSSNSYSLC